MRAVIAFAALLITLAVSPSAYSDGSGPIDPFPITGAYSAFHREDRDHISIIDFAGNYDRELAPNVSNVEPRAVIAREFFRTHPDNYDFIVAFSLCALRYSAESRGRGRSGRLVRLRSR